GRVGALHARLRRGRRDQQGGGRRAGHRQRRPVWRRLADQDQALDRRRGREAHDGGEIRRVPEGRREGKVKFLPVSDADRTEMLRAIGAPSVEALFSSIPREVRQAPDLPGPLSEIEIRRLMGGLSSRNATARDTAFFLGAGLYNHYVSAIADQ